ncbi:BTB/POZ domain-containing protein KCTD2 [Desulfovibrio sp. OttesenSCG-928-C06]|nr:BTB/POZ domain-containing protein KCTD2 [Desulfovibrio sp. OttesenSCG-928-C06]
MFKKVAAFALLLTLCTSSYAFAACSQEEVVAKAQEFQQVIMQAAQKDPQKYQEVVTAMQKDLPALQQANNMDAICTFYDEWTEKLK